MIAALDCEFFTWMGTDDDFKGFKKSLSSVIVLQKIELGTLKKAKISFFLVDSLYTDSYYLFEYISLSCQKLCKYF